MRPGSYCLQVWYRPGSSVEGESLISQGQLCGGRACAPVSSWQKGMDGCQVWRPQNAIIFPLLEPVCCFPLTAAPCISSGAGREMGFLAFSAWQVCSSELGLESLSELSSCPLCSLSRGTETKLLNWWAYFHVTYLRQHMASWNTWIYFSSLMLNSLRIGKLQHLFCVTEILSSYSGRKKQHNFGIKVSGSVTLKREHWFASFFSPPFGRKCRLTFVTASCKMSVQAHWRDSVFKSFLFL